MKYGIVGARQRKDKQTVIEYVNRLPDDAIVVSRGQDTVGLWAVEAAKARGLQVVEFLPEIIDNMSYRDMLSISFAATVQVMAYSDIIVSFFDPSTKEKVTGVHTAFGKQVIIL